MSDENTNEETQERETVVVELDALKEVIRETVDETVTARLDDAGVGQVDRSRVAVTADNTTEETVRSYGSAGRVAPAFEALYRQLPEWQQKIRTPEVDHHIGQWAIGVMRNDHARMARSHDAIDNITGITRDLNTTSDSALVPSPLANMIVELKRKIQVIGPRARTFVSESTTLGIPTEVTFAAAAGVAEGGTISPTDPTTATVTLTKKKSVVATRSSIEFIEDNAFNAVSFLSEQAARTIALRNDAQDFADGDGTGTNQSDAIEQAGITEVDATVGTLAYNDILDLWYTLLSQYRMGAVWMGGNGVMKELSQLNDGNTRPIFNPGLDSFSPISGGQGAPGVGSIFGRPVLELAGATAGVLVLGDLNYYGVLESGGIRAETSRDVSFLTDEITWKWVQRRDGAVLQTEAFKKLGGITEA